MTALGFSPRLSSHALHLPFSSVCSCDWTSLLHGVYRIVQRRTSTLLLKVTRYHSYAEAPSRTKYSHHLQSSINRKRRQNKHHGINTPPNKGYPSTHLKVSTLIHTSQPATPVSIPSPNNHTQNLQTPNNTPRNQPLNRPHRRKHRRRNPYNLPIAPLNYARPQCDNQVYAADE